MTATAGHHHIAGTWVERFRCTQQETRLLRVVDGYRFRAASPGQQLKRSSLVARVKFAPALPETVPSPARIRQPQFHRETRLPVVRPSRPAAYSPVFASAVLTKPSLLLSSFSKSACGPTNSRGERSLSRLRSILRNHVGAKIALTCYCRSSSVVSLIADTQCRTDSRPPARR